MISIRKFKYLYHDFVAYIVSLVVLICITAVVSFIVVLIHQAELREDTDLIGI